MKTFGTIISDARKASGISQRELAAKIKKDDGTTISAQYLNDVEHDRRNPPSEHIIAQMAELLELSNDLLCAAANTLPDDLKKLALKNPDKFEEAMRAFRKSAK
jgi:transcriptional regulator with XRE-family HTH domain